MRRRWILTPLLVAAGVGIGAATGGPSGLVVGGLIGFLLGWGIELHTRLDEVAAESERARRAAESLQSASPPPQPVESAQPPSPADDAPQEQAPSEEAERDSPRVLEPDISPEVPLELSQPPGTSPPPDSPASPAPFHWFDDASSRGRLSARDPASPPFPGPLADRVDVGSAEPLGGTTRDEEPIVAYESPVSLLQKAGDAARTWLTTGNSPVKVGAIVLLVGVGLLIREASRRGIFTLTIEVRLIAVAVFAVILLALGWRQRERRPTYGRSLQGAAIAVLYLTTYAAGFASSPSRSVLCSNSWPRPRSPYIWRTPSLIPRVAS